MFHIALYEPRIAPNTGNIMRLTANNGCHLHLIEPLGFDLEEKKLRRAGLDYRDLERVTVHKDFVAFAASVAGRRIFAFSTKGHGSYDQADYHAGDVLLFGSETSGLPLSIMQEVGADRLMRIPMQDDSRSMNLSNAVAIVSYEAWRQLGFPGGR